MQSFWADLNKKHTRWVIIGLLLLGFFLRVHDLTGTPPGLDGDETFYFFDASRALHGDLRVYYETNYGHEPIFIYMEALMLRLLGDHAFTLRYTAVLGGMLMLASAYVLARRLFTRTTALVTLALFATLGWPVFMTRVGLRAFTFPLFTILSIYALWRALRDKSWRWAIGAGVFNGLTLYTYLASRVFPVVSLLWLLTLLIFDRRWLRGNWGRIILALGLAAVIILPFALFALRNPDIVNQRLYTMGGPFYEIQHGNFSGLFQNVGHIMGMFIWRGDAEARYNVDARPIFDPLTGVLFYLGVVIALGRLRQPAYSLLWIWLLTTLAPTLLAIGAPSFLRASGALFPILVLAGLGVDWLLNRFPRPATFVPALFIGALGVGAWTAYGLFVGPWRSTPVLMRTYESDVYLTARYVQEKHLPPDANLIIVAGAAADNSPTIFRLQTPHPVDAQFTSFFVWPARPTETWYFFHQETPPDELTRAWLGVPPVDDYRDNAGNVQLTVYHLPEPPPPPAPEIIAPARFDHLVDLLGVSYLRPFVRGEPIEVLLFWRVRPDFSFDPTDLPTLHFSLRSRNIEWDDGGGLLAYPPHQWKAGDIWAQRVRFNIPADMPPQSIQPAVSLTTSKGAWPVIAEGADRARTEFLLPAVTVSGQPVVAAPPSETVHRFSDALALITTVLPANEVGPGLPLFVKTTWQALRDLDVDYALQLQIIDPDGGETVSVTQTLLQAVYPTHNWRQGEQVSTNDPIYLPTTSPSGDYRLRLRVVRENEAPLGDWVELGNIRVTGRPHLLTPPPMDTPLNAQFGEVARLVGYRLNLEAAHPGGEIKLTLIWQALHQSATPLKVFAHLYTLADTVQVLAQHDGPPAGGAILTSTWLEGEYIEDTHVIPLDASLPPGTYRLGVGMYDPDLLQRLSVRSDTGVADVVLLTNVSIPSQ